jgi:hypothetical protein
MSSVPLNHLLKIGSEVLQTTAQTLSGAINELKAGKSTVSVASSGTASSTTVHKQTITVDGTGVDVEGTIYMEQSVTLDASDPTIATFTNAAITAASKIEVYVSTWNLVPEDVSCAAGTCAVTFPADEDESTITVGIYVR